MESDFLAQITAFSKKNPHPSVPLGIGDDAAVLKRFERNPVVTVDMLMDGTDFLLDELEPQLVGRKALAVNLSDIAAMAARPVAALVAVALPQNGVPFHKKLLRPIESLELAQLILSGIRSLADDFSVAIAGGDTNTWNSPLAISITMIGEATSRGVLRRDAVLYDSVTGRGDAIWVTGTLGGSILAHHYAFTPRIHEAVWLHEHTPVHAAMDISDGLSLDLSRLAMASGCGIIVDLDAIPIANDAYRLAKKDGRSPLQHALSDGEDFELILAMDPDWDKSKLGLENDETIFAKADAVDSLSQTVSDISAESNLSVSHPSVLHVPSISRTSIRSVPLIPCVSQNVPLTRIGTVCAEPGLWTRMSDGTLQPLKPEGWLH